MSRLKRWDTRNNYTSHWPPLFAAYIVLAVPTAPYTLHSFRPFSTIPDPTHPSSRHLQLLSQVLSILRRCRGIRDMKDRMGTPDTYVNGLRHRPKGSTATSTERSKRLLALFPNDEQSCPVSPWHRDAWQSHQGQQAASERWNIRVSPGH